MSQPRVTITELRNALGVVPPGSGTIPAYVGPADAGPLNTPAVYGRLEDLEEDFEGGPIVRWAAYRLARFGGLVAVCRTAATTVGAAGEPVEAADGTVGAVTRHGTGSSVGSIASSPTPNAAYDVVVRFPIGGTIGVTGMVYQVSLDGGATYGFATALGTANNLTIPGAGGVQLNLGAGTIASNDYYTFTTTAPTLESDGTLVVDFEGSSTPTIGVATANDDYEPFLTFPTGGTIGVAGITLQWSLDGGRTLSPVTALGTADEFTFPNSGGLRVDFDAGTIEADDSLVFTTTQPLFSAAELTAAMDALAASNIAWDGAIICGSLLGATFDALDAAFSAMAVDGNEHWGIAHAPIPLPDETVAAYKTRIDAIFSSRSTTWFALTAGATKTTSDGRQYRRPFALAVGAYESSVKAHKNLAAIEEGPVGGVAIRDENGNPDEYDETLNGVLDGSRYYVARTWKRRAGTFVNRPRIFGGPTDDVQLVPQRRVLNIFNSVINSYLETRLSKGIQANPKTGFILEAEAREIEKGAVKAARAELMADPMVSGLSFTLSRTDPLIGQASPTVHGSGRIVGLIYPERFDITTGFAATVPVVNG